MLILLGCWHGWWNLKGIFRDRHMMSDGNIDSWCKVQSRDYWILDCRTWSTAVFRAFQHSIHALLVLEVIASTLRSIWRCIRPIQCNIRLFGLKEFIADDIHSAICCKYGQEKRHVGSESSLRGSSGFERAGSSERVQASPSKGEELSGCNSDDNSQSNQSKNVIWALTATVEMELLLLAKRRVARSPTNLPVDCAQKEVQINNDQTTGRHSVQRSQGGRTFLSYTTVYYVYLDQILIASRHKS